MNIELINKYLDRAENALSRYDLDEETIEEIIKTVSECSIESFEEGAASERLPYQVALQRGKISIEGDSPDTPPAGIRKHYYWTFLAAFALEEEADKYINNLREHNPGTQYGLFVDGIPTDYE